MMRCINFDCIKKNLCRRYLAKEGWERGNECKWVLENVNGDFEACRFFIQTSEN
jgi:hypothetical protein